MPDRRSCFMMAIGILALLAGCDRPRAKYSAEAMQRIRAGSPGMTDACADDLRFGDGAMMNDTARCFRMTKPQRWRGLWLDQFEGQRFCAAPVSRCDDDGGSDDVWISFPEDRHPTGHTGTGRTFAIDFIGRKTLLPGAYGHMGASRHEVLVDRILSIRPIDRRSHRAGGGAGTAPQ